MASRQLPFSLLQLLYPKDGDTGTDTLIHAAQKIRDKIVSSVVSCFFKQTDNMQNACNNPAWKEWSSQCSFA